MALLQNFLEQKKLPVALVALCLVSLTTGCNFVAAPIGAFAPAMTFLNDQLSYNDPVDEMMLGWRNYVWAKKAWANYRSCHRDIPYMHDFGEGYKAGYIDVASGADGCVPLLPPRRYWSWRYQTPEGQCKVNAWFAAYSLGAAQADSDGVNNWSAIQLGRELKPAESKVKPPEVVSARGQEDIPSGAADQNSFPWNVSPLPTVPQGSQNSVPDGLPTPREIIEDNTNPPTIDPSLIPSQPLVPVPGNATEVDPTKIPPPTKTGTPKIDPKKTADPNKPVTIPNTKPATDPGKPKVPVELNPRKTLPTLKDSPDLFKPADPNKKPANPNAKPINPELKPLPPKKPGPKVNLPPISKSEQPSKPFEVPNQTQTLSPELNPNPPQNKPGRQGERQFEIRRKKKTTTIDLAREPEKLTEFTGEIPKIPSEFDFGPEEDIKRLPEIQNSNSGSTQVSAESEPGVQKPYPITETNDEIKLIPPQGDLRRVLPNFKSSRVKPKTESKPNSTVGRYSTPVSKLTKTTPVYQVQSTVSKSMNQRFQRYNSTKSTPVSTEAQNKIERGNSLKLFPGNQGEQNHRLQPIEKPSSRRRVHQSQSSEAKIIQTSVQTYQPVVKKSKETIEARFARYQSNSQTTTVKNTSSSKANEGSPVVEEPKLQSEVPYYNELPTQTDASFAPLFMEGA